jgi:segregation and condensation protein B
MFGTTKGFLDYFSLKKLDDLPPLADLADWESLRQQLNLPEVEGRDGADELAAEMNESELLEDESIDGDSAEIIDIEAGHASEDNDLPVLYPEGSEEGVEIESSSDLEEEEELPVSEWPTPVG